MGLHSKDTEISPSSVDEFQRIYAMLNPHLPFNRIINLFYLLKSLMFEENYLEEALKFGAFIREINKRPKEDLASKGEVIQHALMFFEPFLK